MGLDVEAVSMDRREGRGRPPDLLRGSPGVMGRGARVRHDRPSLRFVNVGMGRQSQCGVAAPGKSEAIRLLPCRWEHESEEPGVESGHWLCVPVPLPEGPAGKSEEAVSEYDPWMFRSGAPGRAG